MKDFYNGHLSARKIKIFKTIILEYEYKSSSMISYDIFFQAFTDNWPIISDGALVKTGNGLTLSLMIVFFLFFLRIFSAMVSHCSNSLALMLTFVGNN
jgi:hypothetical protein